MPLIKSSALNTTGLDSIALFCVVLLFHMASYKIGRSNEPKDP